MLRRAAVDPPKRNSASSPHPFAVASGRELENFGGMGTDGASASAFSSASAVANAGGGANIPEVKIPEIKIPTIDFAQVGAYSAERGV